MTTFQEAAVERARAVWNPAQVHSIGAVPNLPTLPYLAVAVSGGRGDSRRNDGTHGSSSRWIVVQCVGKDAGEIAFALARADEAFADWALSMADYDTTPAAAELEANPTRDPDGGALLVATQTYSFHAYPTE